MSPSVPDPRHVLFDFMRQVTAEMQAEYERIERRVVEDPGTAGDDGEENWASLLREWLPANYHVVTKGRVIGAQGEAPGQLDVLVLAPSYPPKLLDKKMYLAGGVLAAFECKLTLRNEHLHQAAAKAKAIKSLAPLREGTPYRELFKPPFFGVLAHSHSWTAPKARPLDNIARALKTIDQQLDHPADGLDAICVADLATWMPMRITYMGPATIADWGTMPQASAAPEGGAMTSISQLYETESQPHPTAIGAMLAHLVIRLAWEDAVLRPIADYFRLAGVLGASVGEQRFWPLTIYSESVQARIASGQFIEGDPWSEWSLAFF